MTNSSNAIIMHPCGVFLAKPEVWGGEKFVAHPIRSTGEPTIGSGGYWVFIRRLI
jgi:hypothetical protein